MHNKSSDMVSSSTRRIAISIAVHSLLLITSCDGFLSPITTSIKQPSIHQGTYHINTRPSTSRSNDIFYDDFSDTFNDENSSSNIASLNSRINEVKNVEQAYDGKIARNWSKGVSTLYILCAPS